jgi:GDP/UDP-N,N'-diacetylbacillosamine 2-epimerase (hydrolysing)
MANTVYQDKKKHVVYVTSTRADYGLMRNTLQELQNERSLNLSILVCGMHMSPMYGDSIQDIKSDGFNIGSVVDTLPLTSTPSAVAQSIGAATCSFSRSFELLTPDLVLIEGDRGEALAASIAAAYMNIAIAHISGGDVTGTMIDESIRHAITKFAHLHFPGTDLSASRLLSMGEEPWRIHMVGTPGSNVKGELTLSSPEIRKILGLTTSDNLLLVIQHPVTNEEMEAPQQMRNTLESIRQLEIQTVVIKPNSDPGSTQMSEVINEYQRFDFIHTFENLSRDLFIGVLNSTSVMIGNSSSGLTEAPGFGVPVINIGTRQHGRERGNNITDVAPDTSEIITTIRRLLKLRNDNKYLEYWSQSPYVDIDSAHQISKVIMETELGPRLLQKQFNDNAFTKTQE